jgi:rubrerythrin
MADSMSNLADAFAGESQANRRYLAFAKKAEDEGYTLVARRFRVAAASETVHAMEHLKTMGGVKSTGENLQGSISGESYEHETMYPEFIEIAKGEGNEDARFAFYAANEAEKFHEKMFAEALADLASVPDKTFYVCQVCGMTYEDGTPDACVVCAAPKSRIIEVV